MVRYFIIILYAISSIIVLQSCWTDFVVGPYGKNNADLEFKVSTVSIDDELTVIVPFDQVLDKVYRAICKSNLRW